MNETRQEQEQLAKDCLQEGKAVFMQNHIPESIKLLLKAKTIASSMKNPEICAECANVLGVIYGAIGSVNISIDYYLEALKYAEECNYERILELARNNIGSKYMDLGQYEKAVKIFLICEEMMRDCRYLYEEKEIAMVTITYLNLIDSYCKLKDYEKANIYVKKIIPYIEKDPKQVFTFAFNITHCKMKWKMGEKEYVYQQLPGILEGAYSQRDTSNYIQNMSSLCELLKWMGEYEKWENLLSHIEKGISSLNNIYLENFVVKLWIAYYKETAQLEKYKGKCAEFVEMNQKVSEAENQEKASIIDTKIEIYNIVSEHKEAEKKFLLDSLTGVGNRIKLEKDFQELSESLQKDNAKLGIVMIDIDYFKSVNDTYGHLKGDECLFQVAEVLRRVTAEWGNVYRIGGDEFAMLIPNAEESLLEEIALRLKKELHELAIPNENSKVLPEVTLSQGYICKQIRGKIFWKDIFQEVDEILYEVKKAGRNQYRIEQR